MWRALFGHPIAHSPLLIFLLNLISRSIAFAGGSFRHLLVSQAFVATFLGNAQGIHNLHTWDQVRNWRMLFCLDLECPISTFPCAVRMVSGSLLRFIPRQILLPLKQQANRASSLGEPTPRSVRKQSPASTSTRLDFSDYAALTWRFIRPSPL